MMNRPSHLEIEIILRFKADNNPRRGNDHQFWVLVPKNLLHRYRQSPFEFLKDLLASYSVKEIRKVQQIGTCQYVHRQSEGIEWLFRRNGVIYLWDAPHRSDVNRESKSFRKLRNRLVDRLQSGSVDTSTALKRYHVRDAKEGLPPHCQCMLGCDCYAHSQLVAKGVGIMRFALNMLAPRRHVAFAQALNLYERCRSAYKLDVDRESEIVDLIGQCIRNALGQSARDIIDFEWIYHSILFTHDQYWKTILVLILSKNVEIAPIYWSGYDGFDRRKGFREWCNWMLSDLFQVRGLLKKARKYMLRLKAMTTEREWKKIMDTASRNGRYLLDIDRDIDLLQCEVCGVRGSINSGCSACNQVFYCGKRCQKMDWKRGHRKKCGIELGRIKGVPRETFKEWIQKIRFVEKGEVIRGDGTFKTEIIKMVQNILKWSMIQKRHKIAKYRV